MLSDTRTVLNERLVYITILTFKKEDGKEKPDSSILTLGEKRISFLHTQAAKCISYFKSALKTNNFGLRESIEEIFLQ